MAMRKHLQIQRVYTRYYSDNGQLSAYVDWNDGACTQGEAELYNGVRIPCGVHMGALFDRAINSGLTVEHETW